MLRDLVRAFRRVLLSSTQITTRSARDMPLDSLPDFFFQLRTIVNRIFRCAAASVTIPL